MNITPARFLAVDTRLLPEHLSLMFSQMKGVLVANLVIASLSVVVLWDMVDRKLLLSWLMAIYALTATRAWLVAYYQRVAVPPVKALRRAWTFTVTAVASGLLWGSTGALFFDAANPLAIVWVGFVLAGMIGSSVASLSNFMPAYFGFSIPAALPFAIRSFLEGGEVFTALSAITLYALAVNLAYSRATHRTIADAIRLRFERMSLIEQLQQEKERAESASRAKSTFLAAASHDLRQPAHALGLSIATLQRLNDRHPANVSAVRDVVDRMQASLSSLSELLRGLLDISRLDAGVIEPKLTSISLDSLFAKLEHRFAEAAEQKGLTLKFRPTRYVCRSDAIWLERIVGNFIANAIRYTERGGVLCAARRRGEMVEIVVWDTGIGIAQEHHETIFGEFVQLHNTERDRSRGLGLGLAIVRSSAKLLGHEVRLRSTPSRGSAFGITLPACEPTIPPSAETAPVSEERPRARGKIVIIDDDAGIRRALVDLLHAEGYTALACADLAELRNRIYRDYEVSAVVADYRLADGATGDQAIAAAHLILGRRVPAILVTGDTSPERLKQATDSGYRLLHKPVDPDQFIAELEMLISQDARSPHTSAILG
jgi:signal transduction histidine kinase